jgi:translation initiation factor IF-3
MLRITRTIRPIACQAGPSRIHYESRRYESRSAAMKRAEAARNRAVDDPSFFKNHAIPYPIVRLVNPDSNKLEGETRLRDLLASVDLEQNYVQLISTETPDGGKPLVKIINKHDAAQKERDQKSKKKEQKKVASGRESKEIQLSWGVEPGDLKHKLSKSIQELEKKNRVNVVFVKKKGAPMPTPEQQAAKLQAVWEAVRHVATEREPRVIHELTAVLYLQGLGKEE